jgi:hypothetical protein
MRYLFAWLVLGMVLGTASTSAQDRTQSLQGPDDQAPPVRARPAPYSTKERDSAEIAKINAWTVGLAAGQLEGAPIRFATDIARVVDDGNNLHVLPIVTRGPAENVEALLYLKGVDAAIINADTLEQFRSRIPDIQQRITYILNLFPSELHIFARPGIDSLDDLRGKKVNFNTQGTAAAYSGPLIFDKLKLDVQRTFIPHQVALAQMRAGKDDMAAVVFVTSKPIEAFGPGKWPAGFHFLSVPFEDFTFYLPSALSSSDYPDLIPQNQEVQTIAIPTVLAAFNWPKGSNRYSRVARLTDHLFSRLDTLQGPGFHPKWKDVVLNAQVPGLTRFRGAQDWLDRTTAVAQSAPQNPPAALTLTPANERLYREFLVWRKNQQQ